MTRAVCLALILFVVASPAIADELGRKIDEAVQRTTGGGLWGAVLVAKDGKVILSKAYGFADYGDTPNKPETLFEIASASKQFTAAAILRLEQAGKLSIDDPIGKHFDGVPDDKKAITVKMLLNHTSGISPRIGVPYSSPIKRKDYLRKMLAEPLVSKPGEKFAYCNVGYAMLAALVEFASKRSFEDYMAREIFAKAGLENTGVIGNRGLIGSGRDSTRLTNEPGGWTAANWHWGWGYRGMGGVVTTVGDLLKWDRALRGEDVLSADSKKKLYSPALRGYALGWFVATTPRGTTKIHHGGGVAGYGCIIARYLEDDVFIAVLSNGKQNVMAVEAAISDLLFPKPSVKVTIDATPYALNRYRAAMLASDLSFDVKKEGGSVRIVLRHKKHDGLSILVPSAYATKMIRELSQAIAVRERDDEGRPAAIEAGLHLNAYPGKSRITIDEKAEIVFMPEYRGRGEDGRVVVDKRVILVVQDAGRGFWPSIARMNVKAAKELLAGLKKSVK
jgi:CubicO group peptidase (beta-lactamase class C family)